MQELKKTDSRTYGYLKDVKVEQKSDDHLEIIFAANSSIFAQSLERTGKKDAIKAALDEKTGKAVTLTVTCESKQNVSASDKVEKALESFLSKDKIEII